MHSEKHQQLLRNAAEHGGIDAVMKIIAEENPRALHVETGDHETLSGRVFHHQPARSIPMKGFVRYVDWETARQAASVAVPTYIGVPDESRELVADVV